MNFEIPEIPEGGLTFLLEPPWLYIVGLELILLLLLGFMIARLFRPPHELVAFSDGNGKVCITLNALLDIVRATCAHLPGVSRPRIRLRRHGRRTDLDIRLRLAGGARVQEVRDSLRANLNRILTENLGFDNLGQITIIVEEFRVDPADARLAPSLAPFQYTSLGESSTAPIPRINPPGDSD